MNALPKLGNAAVGPLVTALKDKNPDVRRYAIFVLGKIAEPRSVDPLIRVLDDENAGVRSSAAEALGPLNDDRAVHPLICRLGDKDSQVRASAAQSLGAIRDPRALPALKALLEREKDPRVRNAATGAIFQLADAPVEKANMGILTGVFAGLSLVLAAIAVLCRRRNLSGPRRLSRCSRQPQ